MSEDLITILKYSGWNLVSVDGEPEEGLYVAIYRDGDSFPVCLCEYGHWEFYDEYEKDERADDEGMVKGFGWSVTETGRSDDSVLHIRDVVAYLPRNHAFDDPAMKEARRVLAKLLQSGPSS